MDCQTGKGPPPCMWTFVASVVCWCTYSIFNDSLHHPYICECFCRKPLYIYILYMYVCMYIYICQDGGAVGFVDFTKLLFALSSLSQSLKRVRSIPEHFFVILSQRKACAGRFREETAEKRTGPITRWPLRRLLFTRLEIVFVTISSFTKRTKGAQKVFQ